MSQTIVGGSAIKPLGTKLNLSLLVEINGRFVSIRGNHNESSPSIEQLFTEASAPGLRTQPGVVQLGEGVRIKPAFFDNRLELNYLGTFQQYFAPSNSHYSFMRWTVDLGHNFLLYQQTRPALARDTNGLSAGMEPSALMRSSRPRREFSACAGAPAVWSPMAM